MNSQEQSAADHILKMCQTTAKFTKHYLDLLRAVKLRLECEKLTASLKSK